ncbi:hypothetical protein BDZ91DRAFT_723772, partial [Kalaharituber pfeilii]
MLSILKYIAWKLEKQAASHKRNGPWRSKSAFSILPHFAIRYVAIFMNHIYAWH